MEGRQGGRPGEEGGRDNETETERKENFLKLKSANVGMK